MSSKAKLTVCIPCFNEERYIGEAIESLLSQTYKDFSLQVIDDCSTDGTLGIVKRFKDPRIEVHKNRRNLGLYQNQNRCLELSGSRYMKILCADDVLVSKCLEEQVAILEKHPNVSLVFGGSEVIDASGRFLLKRRFSSWSRGIDGRELISKIIKSARNPIGEPSGTMFRRDLVEQYGLRLNTRSFRHMADLDFWIRLLEHGDGYYLNKKLFSFRLHKSAGTAELLKRSVAEHRLLLSKYGQRYSITDARRVLFHLKLFTYFVGKMAFVRLFAR